MLMLSTNLYTCYTIGHLTAAQNYPILIQWAQYLQMHTHHSCILTKITPCKQQYSDLCGHNDIIYDTSPKYVTGILCNQ